MSPISHYHSRGLVWPFLQSAVGHCREFIQSSAYRKLQQVAILNRGKKRHEPGAIHYQGKSIRYIDLHSFLYAWDDIMVKSIYDIGEVDQPYLIDCGANIGLAQCYWKIRYQNFSSICFEPDKLAFTTLHQNLQAWQCTTKAHQAALGASDTQAQFVAAGADAGHLLANGEDAVTEWVPIKRLSSYLDRPVDLLKIDIEGAECEVLEEIKNQLHLVKRIFIECHDHHDRPQKYAHILRLLDESGFRYYTVPGHGSEAPFSAIHLTSDGFDQNTHIFAIKPAYLQKVHNT